MTEAPPVSAEGLPDLGSYRPSLVTLTDDLREHRQELLRGFASRRDLLEWLQSLTVHTLGEVPQQFYDEFSRAFRSPKGYQRTLLAAMLTPSERDRDVETARDFREQLASTTLTPAYHRAFRRLRTDSTEYIDDGGGEAEHSPLHQRFIAMRPAIDELNEWQQQALTTCLDGLDSRAGILDWGEYVELATHGELGEGFVRRCYRERSTARLLTSGDGAATARETFAARHLIPQFNAGVRTLSGRSGEAPHRVRDTEPSKV